MDRDKILAMIITYNPDLPVFRKNLKSIVPQVDSLLLYDNASSNKEEIIHICHEMGGGVKLHIYPENYGVSVPLYEGILYAKEYGYKYILTLDQDSIILDNSVAILYASICSDQLIGMVGSNVNGMLTEGEKTTIITSGTLADVDKVILCGNYNKDLFIDLVDYDICFKMKRMGYKILVKKEVLLNHSFGATEKYNFCGKEFYLQNYSPKRLYYQARNLRYMISQYPEQKRELNAFKNTLNKRVIKILFFENNKKEKIFAYLKALMQHEGGV